jgi:hypothetical protein
MTLIEIQPVIDIIELTLQSAFIKNEKNAVSLMLVAGPEAAKTSSIFNFFDLNFVSYYDEITQKKLIDEFLPLVKNKQIRTLLIPDLINCIEKQRSTRDQFLAIIKSGIDDTGLVRISTQFKQLQYMELAEGLKFNIITAITTNNFKAAQKEMTNSGLLSRFIPFSYSYPIDKIKRIFDLIEGTETNSKVEIKKIIKKDVKIPNSPQYFKEFEMVSAKLGQEYGGFGIRAQINLQRLAKANAILNGRKEVNKEDVQKIISLSKWFNYNYNPM